MTRLIHRKLIEIGHSRGGTHRTKDACWMPALEVILLRFAAHEFPPDFIANDIGAHSVQARAVESVTFGQIAGTRTVLGWPEIATSS